ncbi:(2Fe-2S)-binding protein [Paraburkholderia phenazinium]|jgi:predicted molibdopterin-dependent oxidoreductase YjgC|uniref:2Fe-2S iron-sulfur cluster binding domain-containing protein n=1 Tax=Paraburkholderia phenazinium TaxID=60549 RepID=A0A1G8HV88_9BURK|nr:(2Fe-2S)-binding protein [Paraburkholderia phenazinium]SDI10566.1 2Fe-2S iron-sulfur cluster binding domain-containing protein [Paraburkholderia phenazinium]
MATDSLFKVLPREAKDGTTGTVNISFDGKALRVPQGVSVAAALLAAGIERFRTTPVSGAARAPYCMMGVCFECLVEIDGVANRQSCLVPVAEGMAVRSQLGMRELNDLVTSAGGARDER